MILYTCVLFQSAKKYLKQLENERGQFVINAPIRDLPPKTSSFYWNNDGNKYKVFIPTEGRQFYYNLEEYNMDDINNLGSMDEKLVQQHK